MKKFESKKRHVLPGDFITTAPLRLQDNVVLDGKRVISTTIGLSDVSSDSVRVISLTGVYLPKIEFKRTKNPNYKNYFPQAEIPKQRHVIN